MYIYVHVVVRPNPENNKIVLFLYILSIFRKILPSKCRAALLFQNYKGVHKGAWRHKYPTIGPHDLKITTIFKLKEIY